MALTFPSNPPSPGQNIGYTYAAPNGYTYTWDGTKWYVASTGQGGGGGGTPLIIQDESVTINTATSTLNFVGAAITATTTGTTVTITITADPLTTATTATLGGVKIGTGISITGDGTISVQEGLTYWTENVTVIDSTQTSIVALIVATTQTNTDAVIEPKGLGAITNDQSGNKRGEYAVDWQRVRNNNLDVAAGNFSIISGGSFNKAGGTHSVVIGGNNNHNDGDYATVLGGANGNTRSITGAVIIPGYATGGSSLLNGSLQGGIYMMSATTTDAGQSLLSTNGIDTLSSLTQITLNDRTVIHFKGTVMAKNVAPGNTPVDVDIWSIEGAVKRAVGSTTTNFVYAPTITALTTATHSIFFDLESTLGCFFIRVYPDGATTGDVKWAARIETLELSDLGM